MHKALWMRRLSRFPLFRFKNREAELVKVRARKDTSKVKVKPIEVSIDNTIESIYKDK